MAEVSIREFAGTLKMPVEKLLSQIKEAGLPHTDADHVISTDDKTRLLAQLKKGRGGDAEAAPRKITLKRKTLGTLRTAGSHGRGRTVNVEVRRKRTYIKRSAVDQDEAGKPEETAALEEQKPVEQPAQEAAQAAQETPAPTPETKPAGEEAEPAAETRPAEPPPAQPPAKTDAARGAKAPPKRRGRGKPAATAQPEKRKSSLRPKAPAQKRRKPIHVNDDFVLEGGDIDDLARGRRVGRKAKPRLASEHAFEKPTEFISREIIIGEANTVAQLAQGMSVKSAEIIKILLNMGVMATINHTLDQDTSTLVIEELGHRAKFVSADAIEEQLAESIAMEDGQSEESRAPVVTVMGHVDHGKTSLLDHIRSAQVASQEAGGITQHIGAYQVETEAGMICFLDTPGHAAFTAMRSRGARATDVIVLVVAADDGVKPQTEEAVQHARAAEVPLVVAINKIDKEGIDIERVKSGLAALEVIPEDWGGDTQFIPVSAHTGEGIPRLLEAILLQAELLDLKAYTDVPGQGVVIESRLDKGRGPVATVLVQNGTLNAGDVVLAGHEFGKVRALMNERGENATGAGPSVPAEILGLNGVPDAGDEFVVVADERKAREVAEFRRVRHKESQQARQQSASVESLLVDMGRDSVKLFKVVLKADVRGSLEAINSALAGLNTDEVRCDVVSSGVGGITETDAHLAATSQAMVIGFNVRASRAARDIIDNERLQLRYYNVIYEAIDDAKAVMGGMLAPEIREEIIGVAEVRDVFNSPKFGQIAGSMVVEGAVHRSKPIRVLRDNVVIYEGELESLRRFKDDTNEVRHGMECGIGVRNYKDVQVGDKIEVYETTEVTRTL
ncbi:MAG: translation initiation factor IF-2 [Gammaproteobacteria bacterium]|nr:translation initiation factor IF-2 [Gammaproteobacteria bacterium]